MACEGEQELSSMLLFFNRLLLLFDSGMWNEEEKGHVISIQLNTEFHLLLIFGPRRALYKKIGSNVQSWFFWPWPCWCQNQCKMSCILWHQYCIHGQILIILQLLIIVRSQFLLDTICNIILSILLKSLSHQGQYGMLRFEAITSWQIMMSVWNL